MITGRASFDPQTAALVGRGESAGAIADCRLTASFIRSAFQQPKPWTPIRFDAQALDAALARPAAVLMPLIKRSGGLAMLFTRRAGHLSNHPGQISFPGGQVDADDADAVAAAVREAGEEIGLAASWIDVLGTLPTYLTASRFVVTPVVALIDDAASFVIDRREVDLLFEVPLAFLMNPSNHERRAVHWHDEQGASNERTFYALPYQSDEQQYFIWGATAALLLNFYRLLHAQL